MGLSKYLIHTSQYNSTLTTISTILNYAIPKLFTISSNQTCPILIHRALISFIANKNKAT